MFYGLNRFLKNILPKRLFYRSLLIVAVPVITLQLIISIVFFDSLWIKTNKGMTKALTNEIKTYLEVYDDEIMELKLSESAVTTENPENILEAEELRSKMMDAIQSLPDDIRTTLSLREFDGLSYEEIAKVQNCPIGTVRSRIHKGREILDKTLSKYNMSNLEINSI